MSEKTDIAGGVSVLVDVPGQGIIRMPYRESLHWAKLGRVIREDAPEPTPAVELPAPDNPPAKADPAPNPSPAPAADPAPVPSPARPAFTADSSLTVDSVDITADFE